VTVIHYEAGDQAGADAIVVVEEAGDEEGTPLSMRKLVEGTDVSLIYKEADDLECTGKIAICDKPTNWEDTEYTIFYKEDGDQTRGKGEESDIVTLCKVEMVAV
jgi:hypothetical protein